MEIEKKSKYGEELDKLIEEAEGKLGPDEDKLSTEQETRANAVEQACKSLVPEDNRGELYFIIRDFIRANNDVGLRMFVKTLNGLTRSNSTPQEILQDMNYIVEFCRKKNAENGIKLTELEETREMLEIAMTKDAVIRTIVKLRDYSENAMALVDTFYAEVPTAAAEIHEEANRAKQKKGTI